MKKDIIIPKVEISFDTVQSTMYFLIVFLRLGFPAAAASASVHHDIIFEQ